MDRKDSVGNRDEARRAMPRPGHPAAAVLRMREQLQLTDAQVQRLETLQKSPLPELSESAMMRARADLADATKGDGNPEAARAALERISRLHTDQQVARIRARKEAREVLTAEQKSQLDEMESRFVDRRDDRVGPPDGRAKARGQGKGIRRGAPGTGIDRGVPGFRNPGRVAPPAIRR